MSETKKLVLVNFKSGNSVAFYAKDIKHNASEFSYEFDEDITEGDVQRAKWLLKGKNVMFALGSVCMGVKLDSIESTHIIDRFTSG